MYIAKTTIGIGNTSIFQDKLQIKLSLLKDNSVNGIESYFLLKTQLATLCMFWMSEKLLK